MIKLWVSIGKHACRRLLGDMVVMVGVDGPEDVVQRVVVNLLFFKLVWLDVVADHEFNRVTLVILPLLILDVLGSDWETRSHCLQVLVLEILAEPALLEVTKVLFVGHREADVLALLHLALKALFESRLEMPTFTILKLL